MFEIIKKKYFFDVFIVFQVLLLVSVVIGTCRSLLEVRYHELFQIHLCRNKLATEAEPQHVDCRIQT